MTLSEGTIQITFNGATGGRKFDDGATHGLSHCMKAVDFIVELPERFLFVELRTQKLPKSQKRTLRSSGDASSVASWTSPSNTSIGTRSFTNGHLDKLTSRSITSFSLRE